jgi:sec-independent protein translocase protein TatB
MFDIGFWELTVIAVVALIVIGPERLPGLARNVGMWVGRARRFVGSVQSEINQELAKADELKRLLDEQKKIIDRHEILEETSETSVPVKQRQPASDTHQVTQEPESPSSPKEPTEQPNEPPKADSR